MLWGSIITLSLLKNFLSSPSNIFNFRNTFRENRENEQKQIWEFSVRLKHRSFLIYFVIGKEIEVSLEKIRPFCYIDKHRYIIFFSILI